MSFHLISKTESSSAFFQLLQACHGSRTELLNISLSVTLNHSQDSGGTEHVQEDLNIICDSNYDAKHASSQVSSTSDYDDTSTKIVRTTCMNNYVEESNTASISYYILFQFNKTIISLYCKFYFLP